MKIKDLPISQRNYSETDKFPVPMPMKFTVLNFAPIFNLMVEKLSEDDKKWIEERIIEWSDIMNTFNERVRK